MNNEQFFELVDLFLPLNVRTNEMMTLLYRASRDGFTAADFHAKCDGFPDTMTVVKTTTGRIFGGYIHLPVYSEPQVLKCDEKAFIFSLVNDLNQPLKFKTKKSYEYAAFYQKPYFGPNFGSDLLLSLIPNQGQSHLGDRYKVPRYVNDPNKFLAGESYFDVAEIEVFRVDFIEDPVPNQKPNETLEKEESDFKEPIFDDIISKQEPIEDIYKYTEEDLLEAEAINRI